MSPAPTDVRTISREELRAKLAGKEPFKLVTALHEWAYKAKHIPGSLYFKTSEQMLAALGKDDDIVVYCSNVDCHASLAAYQALLEHGYHKVRRYAGGLFDWESAGLPLEGDWITPT